MGYRIGYNGPEVDRLLQKAYTYSVVNNGWSKIESSDTDPADLDTLVTPGNYSISFWKNAPVQLITSGPINVCVTKDSATNKIYQTIYDAGKIYIRETDGSSLSNTWIEEQNNSELDVSSAEPINPSDNYIWIDTSGEVPVIKIYKKSTNTWETVKPTDMAKQSIYDSKGVKQNITTYLDNKMSEGQLDKADELYEKHINDTEEVINISENSMPSKQEWKQVTYGNGKFVAIDGINTGSNVFAYSTDGITWTQGTMPSKQTWTSVCYGNDKFVVIGSVFAYSTDGITWTQGTMSSTQYWGSVCYGNGKFVAVSWDTNIFAYSTDGITWTQGTLPSSQEWQSICYGNGKFVAVTYSSNIFAYSSDGITWTQSNMPSSQYWSSVCYGNNKFVAITDDPSGSNIFAYSSDGITWTQDNMPSEQHWQSVCYGNGKFVAVTYGSNVFAYSTDSITWTQGNMPSEQYWYSVCYSNDKFVVIENNSNISAVISFDSFPIHVTAQEKLKWSNGISETDAQTYIDNLNTEMTQYSDKKIQEKVTSVNTINSTITEDKTNIEAHINDNTVHLTDDLINEFDGKAAGNHKHLNNGSVTVSSKNLTGLIPIERLDPSVLERNYTVNSYSEMMMLTKTEVQNGDSVYIKGSNETKIEVNYDTMPSNKEWSSVCYGNDKFVTIADTSNVFAYSTDGINWTQGTMPSNQYWYSICYGNGKFVAIAKDTDVFAYSTDGITWTQGTMPSSQYWRSICYGNDKFVAIAYNSNVFAYSTDGITWTRGTMPSNKEWSSVCYGNDKFVTIAGTSNVFAYSTDGITWTKGNMPSTQAWQSVCYGNGKFVAMVYNSDTFAYSTDGITWTQSTLPSSQSWWSVCYGNDKFVAICINSDVFAYSTDGITWTKGNMPNTQAWSSVCYGNSKFVAVGYNSNIFASITFTEISTPASAYFVIDDTKLGQENYSISKNNMPSSQYWKSVCYGNGKFVAVAENTDTFAYSTDGITWTQGNMPSSQAWYSICYGNDKFIAVINYSNKFAYSTDGITWTEGTMPSTRWWRSVYYDNGKFVVIGSSSNAFAYSTDGITWTEGTLPSTAKWTSICYGNGKYVAVANKSDVFVYSSDGITWTQGTMPSSKNWQSVCYGNNKFVAVAYGSNVFAYSTDGITWTQGTMPGEHAWQSVCYDNGKFVAIVNGSAIFAYSTDGITWTRGNMGDSPWWISICYGNGKFVVIANNSNVFAIISDFTPAGLIQYAAPNPELTWDNILNKPTSISDYGVTNVYSKEEIEELYNSIINSLNKSKEIAENFNSGVTVNIPADLTETYKTNLLAAAKLNQKLDELLHSLGFDDTKINDIINMYKNRNIKLVNKKDPVITKHISINYIDSGKIPDGRVLPSSKTITLDNINNISEMYKIDDSLYPGYKITDEIGNSWEFSGWKVTSQILDLASMQVGSTFKLGKYQVENETPWPIEWEIVHQTDDYQIAMTKQIIDVRCFDAAEPTNPGNNRRSSGNNNWQYSNIKQWLNSDQSSWYSAQHSYDAPPNKDNCRQYTNGTTFNAYDTHKGFLYYWNEDEKKLLKDYAFTLANNSADGGGSYTWTGKVFLPTYTQMGFGNNNNIAEGTKFSKFTDNASRIKSLHPNCVANNEYCKVNNYASGRKDYYWMSSMHPSYSDFVRYVYGGSGSYIGAYNVNGLAPCICLPRHNS